MLKDLNGTKVRHLRSVALSHEDARAYGFEQGREAGTRVGALIGAAATLLALLVGGVLIRALCLIARGA